MRFIETLFGVSPDGGNGTLEALWIVVLLVAVGAFAIRAFRRRDLPRPTSGGF